MNDPRKVPANGKYRKAMPLFFVKFHNSQPNFDTIVFCLTAANQAEAEAAGRALINPLYQALYIFDAADVIAHTTEFVRCFEPV